MTIHRVWQNINLMFIGFVIGQINAQLSFEIMSILTAIWLVSLFVEARFDKKDVSGWRNKDFKLR